MNRFLLDRYDGAVNVDPRAVASWAAAHPVPALITAALALAVLVAAVRVTQAGARTIRRMARGRAAEDILTLFAAVIATVVAMTGMWRFFGDVLHASGPLRMLTFAFIEIAVFTSALRARRNVRESVTHAAGVDGAAVWTLTGLSAALAALDAGSFRGALLRLSAPMVAAWLWERSMAVERRRATGRAINWRLTPERVLVRLGLAEASDRTASDVDAHRRLSRLARSAKHVRALHASESAEWRLRRAQRRLDVAMGAAVEHTGLATDTARQDALMAQLGALYHATALAELTPPAPWDRPAPVQVCLDERPVSGVLATAPTGPVEDVAGETPVNGHRVEPSTPGALKSAPPPTASATVPAELEPYVRRARRRFREELERGQLPSVRRLKTSLHIGQKRAGQVKAHLLPSADR